MIVIVGNGIDLNAATVIVAVHLDQVCNAQAGFAMLDIITYQTDVRYVRSDIIVKGDTAKYYVPAGHTQPWSDFNHKSNAQHALDLDVPWANTASNVLEITLADVSSVLTEPTQSMQVHGHACHECDAVMLYW